MPREKLDNSSYSTEIFLKYLQNKKMRILSLWFPREGRDMKIQGTDENTHITNNTLHVREFHNTYWFFFLFFFFIEILGWIERNCSWQLCFTYNDGLNYKRDVDNSNFPFWRGTGLIEMNPTNVESMTEYILIHIQSKQFIIIIADTVNPWPCWSFKKCWRLASEMLISSLDVFFKQCRSHVASCWLNSKSPWKYGSHFHM